MALYIKCDECLADLNPKTDDYLNIRHQFGPQTLLEGAGIDIYLCEECINRYFEKFIK